MRRPRMIHIAHIHAPATRPRVRKGQCTTATPAESARQTGAP
ncbi:hypothetical protein [Acidovorax sp. Root275]|nr:hypothetical protein [Acidovorax sp. Root275]